MYIFLSWDLMYDYVIIIIIIIISDMTNSNV